MLSAEVVVDTKAILGESPAWDAKTQTLYWVDILGKKLYSFNRKDSVIQLEDFIGCVAPCADGRLVLALRNGIWKLDLDTDKMTQIAVLQDESVINRFNDGKCDPAGRFLAGTMDMAERQASGSLYSFAHDGKIQKLLTGLRISNGMAWSPDHKTFYFIDTPTRVVKAFDYDIETGAIANPRTAIEIPGELGSPDGMTSDTQGHLWIGMWGGAQVTCWDAGNSRLLEQVKLPALNVTSCVFGGNDLNELYITTARKGLDAKAIKDYPFSGGLFRLQTGTTGMPTFEFG